MRKKRKLLALQHLLFFSVVCHSARFEIEVSLLSSDRNSNLAPFSRAHSNKQIQKHHHQQRGGESAVAGEDASHLDYERGYRGIFFTSWKRLRPSS